jgi:Na+:H+ antiporter, NhaC family
MASRGGMDSMLNTFWLIIMALAFGGVVEKAGVLERLIAPVIEKAKSNGALIPWNSCGAYMAATLGVATWSYAPWAFFSYLSPLLTVAIAYAGIRMLRTPDAGPATSKP